MNTLRKGRLKNTPSVGKELSYFRVDTIMLSLRTLENLNLKYQLVLFESAVDFVSLTATLVFIKDPVFILQKLVPYSTAQ